MFSLAKYVSMILSPFFFSFFFLPYICSKRADSSCFHLLILLLFDPGMISAGMPPTFFSFLFFKSCSFNVMSVLICAARKMFPKRKLNESGSGSDSQKEEAEVKEEQGQQNKRPRVETSASGEGMLSLLLRV